MDRRTYNALREIVTFAQRTHCEIHPDAHYKAFQKVFAWMREVEKGIDDLDTLGTDSPRRTLKPVD